MKHSLLLPRVVPKGFATYWSAERCSASRMWRLQIGRRIFTGSLANNTVFRPDLHSEQ